MTVIDELGKDDSCNLAIVISRFNQEVTSKLLDGALSRIAERKAAAREPIIVWVPGAVEIPVTALALAKSRQFDAIVCLGAVIKGDTDHFTYVCEQVSYGCQKVALEYRLPVVFGVLTTDTEAQAFERAGGAHGNKGADAIDTAVEMVRVLRQLG